MSPSDVTWWINRLEEGEHESVQQLWPGYYRRLVALASKKRRALPCAAGNPYTLAV
jgi:hypothetical protein